MLLWLPSTFYHREAHDTPISPSSGQETLWCNGRPVIIMIQDVVRRPRLPCHIRYLPFEAGNLCLSLVDPRRQSVSKTPDFQPFGER